MKNMKKLLLCAALGVMVLSFAACGTTDKDNDNNNSANGSTEMTNDNNGNKNNGTANNNSNDKNNNVVDDAADAVENTGDDIVDGVEDIGNDIENAVDDAVGLQVLPGIDGGVFDVLGEDAPVGADHGGSVAQNALDHHQVSAGLHRAAGLDDAAHVDVAHGPDGEAAEHIALNVDVADKVDVPRGEVHIALDVQHGLDLKAAAGELHMPRHGGDEGEPVLADLGVPPLGQGNGFAALGGDLLVQHGPPGVALGGLDQPADLLPQLHVADQIQVGVVHLPEFIHLQHPVDGPGEVVHNVAVFPVKGGLPLGEGEQVEVLSVMDRQAVHQMLVYAVGDALIQHGLKEQIPTDLLPLPDGGEDDDPGIELIRGEEEVGLGVQGQSFFRLLQLLLVLLLAELALIELLYLLHTGAAEAGEGCAQTGQLPPDHLLGKCALLV